MTAVLFLLWRLMRLLMPCVHIYMALPITACIVLGQPRLLGLSVAPIITGLNLSASVDGIVNCLFLVDACNAFCSSGLGLTVCLLLLVDLPVANMLPGLIGYAHTVGVLLLPMNYT